MKKASDIQKELETLAPKLAAMKRPESEQAPPFYFANLGDKVMARIETSEKQGSVARLSYWLQVNVFSAVPSRVLAPVVSVLTLFGFSLYFSPDSPESPPSKYIAQEVSLQELDGYLTDYTDESLWEDEMLDGALADDVSSAQLTNGVSEDGLNDYILTHVDEEIIEDVFL